jgi:gliding motility-associated-like protein
VRSLLSATLAAGLALAGLLTPVAGTVSPVAAAGAPKVVIVVGPVGSTTASYRSDGDAAAAEALKYTPNVVKVYSPDATWDAVKAALQGASIVIYEGHGNGFPSPYSTTLQPDRQDGLGLNPSAGVNDTSVTYWGEQYLASDVRLAPNAVVVLGHLCYASGSSEPGRTDPTLAEAKQRVDNFASGFLAAGASAVIAEAYGGAAASYVTALFTAHDTIGNIWANSFSKQGNLFAFASSRTPGATVEMDPDAPSGKYYRALTGDLALSSDAVTGGTAPNPAPNPAPAPDPGPGPSPTPSPTPSASIGPPATTPADDGSKVQLSSSGISLTSISAPPAFSPNGDGRMDTFPIRAQLSTGAIWQLTITDHLGTVFASRSGSGSAIAADWDGTSGGGRLPDGLYSYRLSAANGFGGALDRTAFVRIDTVAPIVTPVSATGSPSTFSPNGDGVADTWQGSWTVNEDATLSAVVVASDGSVVRHLTGSPAGTAMAVTWDGRTDAGAGAPDGQYLVVPTATDPAGNDATGLAASVTMVRALSRVTASRTIFYPQDGDAYAASTRLSLVLLQPATVTWTIVNAQGQTVATRDAGTTLAAGTWTWDWAGLDQAGRSLPPGVYTAVVTAGNGLASVQVRTVVMAAAFRISVSPSKAVRGRTITVTAVSAEPLTGRPTLTLGQPGAGSRTVTMTKVGTSTYRVTTRLSAAGSAGTLSLVVTGTDPGHGINVATSSVTLR